MSASNKRKNVAFKANGEGKGQGSANFGSVDYGTKSPKRYPSDSPSASATNAHGCEVVDTRLRSVLCHPLGLPLMCVFNGNDPSALKCLKKDRPTVLSIGDQDKLDKLLSTAVVGWRRLRKGTEDDLTKSLTKKIESMSGILSYHAHSEVHLRDNDANRSNPPRIDILLSPAKDKKKNEEPTSPYAIVEFGLDGMDWSKKLDQNVKYLDFMVRGSLATDTLEFQHPILCSVVTIEADKGQPFAFKIGVFLCSRRDPQDPNDLFRMSLLWHAKTEALDEASRHFGNLLRGTRDFRFWVSETGCFETTNEYEYLSTSCCKCKLVEGGGSDDDLVVLRSYDNRVRTSNRNPEIYLSADCQQKAGVGKTHVVFTLVTSADHEDPKELDKEMSNRDLNTLETTLWNQGGRRTLQIISTPYREGEHVPKTPASFIPVILQLQKLQRLDYVHGDIRAYNTVFGSDPSEGWLIDFDFGGKEGQSCFPKGYRTKLEDAHRIGKEFQPIKKFHDWHSLGRMIFELFDYDESTMDMPTKELFYSTSKVWKRLRQPPRDEQISELVDLLEKMKNVPLQPEPTFQEALEEIAEQQTGNNGAAKKTLAAATGTPKIMKNQGRRIEPMMKVTLNGAHKSIGKTEAMEQLKSGLCCAGKAEGKNQGGKCDEDEMD